MHTKHVPDGTQENLWDLPSVDQAQGEKWIWAGSRDSGLCGERPRIASTASRAGNDSSASHQSIAQLVAAVPPGLALPKDKIITISVIGGPSKGLAQQMVKPHISVGRSGSGADIEIDDPKVSDRHCAVGVKHDIIRLCDLDSQGGTWVGNERVSAAALKHLFEFRVGSSLLLVTVLPAQGAPAEGCSYESDKKTINMGLPSLDSGGSLRSRVARRAM